MNNINSVNLLNNSSFLEQKISTDFNYKIKKELFLLPSVNLITFPLKNAQNTKYYYLEFILNNWIIDNLKTTETGIINNVILQYDLNYSDIPTARGSITISDAILYKIRSSSSYIIVDDLLDYRMVDLLDNIMPANKDTSKKPSLFDRAYKILLPPKAVKLNALNTLHYSFKSRKLTGDSYQIAQNNFGTINFYVNDNPKYELIITPQLFNSTKFILEIKNPIILGTDIRNIKKYNALNILRGTNILDEVFIISGSNINNTTLVPFKIIRLISTNKYLSRELKKIIGFNNNFNLQQSTNLNIVEENSNFYKSNNIKANLKDTTTNLQKDCYDIISCPEEYALQFSSNVYDLMQDKIKINEEIAHNKFDLPLYDKFDFRINILLTFHTFFKYDINLKLIQQSNTPIIGDKNSLITIESLTKNNKEQWVQATNISLSYEEILKFYSSDSFTYSDYERLKKMENDINHA